MRSRLEPKRVVSARLAFNARGADLSSNTLVHIYITTSTSKAAAEAAIVHEPAQLQKLSRKINLRKHVFGNVFQELKRDTYYPDFGSGSRRLMTTSPKRLAVTV